MKLRNVLIAALLSFTVGCASLQTGAAMVFEKAQILGAAAGLANQYAAARDGVAAQFILFDENERQVLEVESEAIEQFYSTMLSLSANADAEKLLIRTSDFLGQLRSVRGSIDRVAAVIEPKAAQLDPATTRAYYAAYTNYRLVSQSLDEALAKGNRRDIAELTIKAIRAAIPLVTTVI